MKNIPENTPCFMVVEEELKKLNKQVNDWVISFVGGSKEKSYLKINLKFDLTKVEGMAYLNCDAEVFRGLRPVGSWKSMSKFALPGAE